MKHAILHKYSVLTLIEWTRFYVLFIYFRTNLFHAPQTFCHHVVFLLFFFTPVFVESHVTIQKYSFVWGDEYDTVKIQYIVCRYAPVFAPTEKSIPNMLSSCFFRIYMNSEIFSRFVVFSSVLVSCVLAIRSTSIHEHYYTIWESIFLWVYASCWAWTRRSIFHALMLHIENRKRYTLNVERIHTQITFDKGVPVYDYIH